MTDEELVERLVELYERMNEEQRLQALERVLERLNAQVDKNTTEDR